MGGDSVVSHDDDSSLEEESPLLTSPTLLRDNKGLQDEDNRVNGEGDTGEESIWPSSRFDFEVNMRRRHSVYQEILQNYDEMKNRCKNLKEAKEKILSFSPGAWVEKVGGLKLCDYDVPKTTCLLLVGPRGSGKSSLINRISKVFDDDKFATARAQVSYNSLIGDGTYFLQEYMIPRDSTSICLYDTRGLSDNSQENENNRMLKSWITEGVHHGKLVVRNTDDQRLRKSLKSKAHKNGFFSSKIRKINFVIYVVNGLSVLKAMENTGALERQYTETIVSTFNCPFLSFKDDKPVLVFTHGDLLSLSERARVRAHLGELLGIPPTKQIFDIPACDDPATESTVVEMLRYSLEHAERNYPHKNRVLDKVHKASLSLFMILLILGLAVAIALAHNKFIRPCHIPQHQAGSEKFHSSRLEPKAPQMQQNIPQHETGSEEVHTSRPESKAPQMQQNMPQHQAGSEKVQASHPKPKAPQMQQNIPQHQAGGKVHASPPKPKAPQVQPNIPQHQTGRQKIHASRRKPKAPRIEQKIDWYKIRHIW